MFITVEYLTDLLNDKNRSVEEHERAATALAFYAERVKYPHDHPECGFDSTVAQMLASMEIQILWFSPDDVLLQTHVGSDGSTYRSVASKKYHGPQAYSETPAPIPAQLKPAPQREPIVESVAPSEERQILTFDERYHPSEIARRVARIDAESAELRQRQEQADEIRGFKL